MLLSYDPAFLFIHIDKSAGSSIQLALQPDAPKKSEYGLRRRLVWLGRLNRLGLYRLLEFPEHATGLAAERCLPASLFASLFKFAFVRNPWDRLVSRYAFLLRSTDHPRHSLISGMKDFSDYVAWEISRGKMFQHTYVTDARGELLVDFIGYYERLQEDFAKVCVRLGVRAELPRANTSSHRDYRTYYTPATRELVAKHFQRDIELFGYTFDGLRAENAPPGAQPGGATSVFKRPAQIHSEP